MKMKSGSRESLLVANVIDRKIEQLEKIVEARLALCNQKPSDPPRTLATDYDPDERVGYGKNSPVPLQGSHGPAR